MKQPFIFEKIKAKYGMYPKPMMVNLEVAKTMDRKRMTRRIPQVYIHHIYKSAITELDMMYHFEDGGYKTITMSDFIAKYSKWQVGDILWVREPVEITWVLKTGSHSEGDYQKLDGNKYFSNAKIADYLKINIKEVSLLFSKRVISRNIISVVKYRVMLETNKKARG